MFFLHILLLLSVLKKTFHENKHTQKRTPFFPIRCFYFVIAKKRKQTNGKQHKVYVKAHKSPSGKKTNAPVQH